MARQRTGKPIVVKVVQSEKTLTPAEWEQVLRAFARMAAKAYAADHPELFERPVPEAEGAEGQGPGAGNIQDTEPESQHRGEDH